jgi:hypothetical protein
MAANHTEAKRSVFTVAPSQSGRVGMAGSADLLKII